MLHISFRAMTMFTQSSELSIPILLPKPKLRMTSLRRSLSLLLLLQPLLQLKRNKSQKKQRNLRPLPLLQILMLHCQLNSLGLNPQPPLITKLNHLTKLCLSPVPRLWLHQTLSLGNQGLGKSILDHY